MINVYCLLVFSESVERGRERERERVKEDGDRKRRREERKLERNLLQYHELNIHSMQIFHRITVEEEEEVNG